MNDNLRTVAKWAGRSTAAVLLLFWGAFFIEHLVEWFFQTHHGYPPPWIWWQQVFHLLMLIGLALMLKWDKVGSVVMMIGTVVFLSSIGFKSFLFLVLYNLVPVICFSVYWFDQMDDRRSGRPMR